MELIELIQHFQHRYPFLQNTDIEQVLTILEFKTLEIGEAFIRVHEHSQRLALIQQGMVRGFYIKDSGQEVTVIFRAEGSVIGAWECLWKETPSGSGKTFEAIEPTQLVILQFPDLQKLMAENPRIARVYMEMLHSEFANVLHAWQTYVNDKPEERYLRLMNEQSEWVQRISQRHLASFLGITPESLSRLRARLANNSKKLKK